MFASNHSQTWTCVRTQNACATDFLPHLRAAFPFCVLSLSAFALRSSSDQTVRLSFLLGGTRYYGSFGQSLDCSSLLCLSRCHSFVYGHGVHARYESAAIRCGLRTEIACFRW